MNRIVLIVIIVLFGEGFLSACSKNLMPPLEQALLESEKKKLPKAGVIREENVDETGASGEFSSASSSKKSESTKIEDDTPFSISQEEARLSDLVFKSTSELQDIHFEFDKYDLDDKSRAILSKNARYLKFMNPEVKIEIQGHCDERGTNNYNVSLAERRAQSTKLFLVSQGVDSKRVRTISFGEEKPFCLASNEKCWFENRRAHFRISG